MRVLKVIMPVVIMLLMACAQVVTPTGGPKDETPPVVLKESPPNRSVNFNSEKIVITFDEFIQFQNPTENVIISPPLSKTPEYSLKRKSLVIELQEELVPDATYIFNFGEAIRDNNESNILDNYTYVLSTGAVLDSMELKGELTDAITGEPVEGAMLMLYRNDVDSLPRTTLPDYFARTGKDGHFHIRNIPDLPYKVFALKDQNTNYRFDVPDEQVGFLDTLVHPVAPPRRASRDTTATSDSLMVDSLKVPIEALPTLQDTLGLDTLSLADSLSHEHPDGFLHLRMFVEEDTTQFLKKSACEHYGKLIFVYNRPVSRFSALLPAHQLTFKKQWAIKEFSAKRDTVTLWTTDVAPDTLDLILSADGQRDTVQLVMKARKDAASADSKGLRKSKAKRGTTTFGLTLQTHPHMGRPPLPGDPLQLIWNHPVPDIDLSGMALREDSILVNFHLTSTDTALRRFDLQYPWKAGSKYSLHINDSSVTDLFGLRNDTIDFGFAAMKAEDLGEITLKVSNLEGQKLLELIDGSKRTVATRVVNSNGVIQFPRLTPGSYSLIMVDDLNANGRWDSGRYAYKLQPEPYIILKTAIDVRANWQMELEWDASGTEME